MYVIKITTRSGQIFSDHVTGEAHAVDKAERLCKTLKSAKFSGVTIEVVNDRTAEVVAVLAIE